MRPTIKEVAKACGVSPSTVSLVLNARETRISAETKEKIFAMVKQMKYRPNRLAVGLVKRETRTLGLIVPDINELYYSDVCKGCENMSRTKGYSLAIVCNKDCPENDFEYLDMFDGNNVDGVIYVASNTSDRRNIALECQYIANLKLPTIAIDCCLDVPGIYSLNSNHYLGAFSAIRFLANQGHRKIACITGPMCNDISVEMLKGYYDAVKQFNCVEDSKYIYYGDLTVESGIAAFEHLNLTDITAVFCFSDLMAMAFNKAMRSSFQTTPNVSIIGYGDSIFNDLITNPLTSVRQPTFMIGQCAVNLLCDIINGSLPVQDTNMVPTIHIRKSTFEIEDTY